MSQQQPQQQPQPQPVVVVPGQPAPPQAGEEQPQPESVESPAKVMRIGAMVRQLLEEVRQAPLDEESRTRLREVYETSVKELSSVLSPELQEELATFSPPFEEDVPSDAELRVAHAQLVGWLEGLFHGIQAMLFAQQMESRARLDQMRRGLPPGAEQQQPTPDTGQGTYL
jgi:hypothetical protein